MYKSVLVLNGLFDLEYLLSSDELTYEEKVKKTLVFLAILRDSVEDIVYDGFGKSVHETIIEMKRKQFRDL